MNEYFKLINSAEFAIFGDKRQQGGGNLYHLLASGTKIFLMRENSLLQYFRDKGYYVYEFERDLNSYKDFIPLDNYKKEKNRALALSEYSSKEINRVYENLID